jgi:protein phosphatase
MKVSVKSDIGLVRGSNQDSYSYRVFETVVPVHLCAVADGIGGYRAGEVASRLALEALAEGVEKALGGGDPLDTILAQSMAAANSRIIRQSLSDPNCAGMGTTVTAALMSEGVLHLGHVGDSRAYLLRSGRLTQVTRDHSLVAELVRNGDLSEDEAQFHPQRNVLTQAFGSDLRVKADVTSMPLEDGDLLLLCTDGLSGAVPASEIERVMSQSESLDQACEKLVAMANELGGHDNVTVLLAGPVRLGGDRK